ncbi:hypothetical protein ACNRWW_14220 [Metabacillus sp. HB246100]
MQVEYSLKNLAGRLNNFANEYSEKKKETENEHLQGFYEGKKSAFKLAAKWVGEIIEDTKQ